MSVDEVVSIILAPDSTENLGVIDLAAYSASLDRTGSSAKLIVELLSRVSSQLMKGSEGWSFRDCLPFEPPICGFLRRVL